MKKFLTLSLAILMILSLTACINKNYDTDFIIVLGGQYSWTPFGNNSSNVTFTVSDEEMLSIGVNGNTVTFSGLAAGEAFITATSGTKEAKAYINIRSGEPPNDENIDEVTPE